MTDQDANVVSQAPVDETPISPSRPNPARKNSLEHHLAHRPDRQELINSNSDSHPGSEKSLVVVMA